MGGRPILQHASSILAVAMLFAAAIGAAKIARANPAQPSTTQLIFSFTGNADGEYTDTELVADAAGNLYGTSVQGGDFSSGTVFEVTPAGVHTVLYSFTGSSDGGEPYKGVTLDAQGNLIGTAVTGGGGSCEGGCGVVFKLTNTGGVWTQTVIHTFLGSDGSGPGSPVAIDAHGNVYGTTPTGGAKGMGVVYQLTPTTTGGFSFHVIHTFTGGLDGAGGSASRLMIDAAGNLYGVCTTGGATNFGNVYKMSLEQGKWHFATLYSFKDQPDGALPYGGLISDKAGNLYGTTYYAGVHDLGTVYRLSLSHGVWTETVLYNFKGGADGSSPISTLASDSAGNLYGTTSAGGASCNCGVIFKMTPATSGKWTESVAYRFPGSPEAGTAYNGLVRGAAGNFYGATVSGGTANDGAIYQFVP